MTAAWWCQNLWAYAVQVALLASAGALAPDVLRLRLPAARLRFYQSVLAVCLLLPVLQPWRTPTDAGQITFTTSAGQIAERPSTRTLMSLEEWALALIAAGIALRAGWLALGFWRLHVYRRESRPVKPWPGAIDALCRALGVAPRFYLSSSISGPVTFGLRHPVILLPSGFDELPPRTQEAICCHELLHVRRHDWLFTVIEESIRAAFWFHPAVWWLLARIQLAREQTVDRETVLFTQNRDEYLAALLSTAAAQEPDLAPAPLFLRKRHLAQRVAAIVQEVSMSQRRLIFSMAACAGLIVLTSGIAVWAFPLQSSQSAEGQSGGKLLHRVQPAYPREAREKRIEGSVVLEIEVDEKGLVSDARVLSGPQELRRAALQAVLQWHYSTETAPPPRMQVTIDFRLPPQGPATVNVASPGNSVELGMLKRVDLSALPEATRDAVLKALPVKEGDRITTETASRVSQAVREVDEHLVTNISVNDGVVFSVHLPAAVETDAVKRIRVGGNVQAKKLVKKVNPVYPPLAKQARIEGTAKLNVTIGRDGAVQNIDVISGEPLLVSAAVEAVKQWVYETTLLNGNPVEVIAQVDVNFTLSN